MKSHHTTGNIDKVSADNIIGNFRVRLFFETDGTLKKWEDKDFQSNGYTTYCYDTVHFHQLIIEGNIDNLTIQFRRENHIFWAKEINKLSGKITLNDLPALENGSLVLLSKGKVFFEGQLLGEGCL